MLENTENVRKYFGSYTHHLSHGTADVTVLYKVINMH